MSLESLRGQVHARSKPALACVGARSVDPHGKSVNATRSQMPMIGANLQYAHLMGSATGTWAYSSSCTRT